MIEFALVAFSFLLSLYYSRRSLVAGLCVVITTGYFYGILRANFLSRTTYFLFDAAVLGFFLMRLSSVFTGASNAKLRTLKTWIAILMIWPFVLFLLPVQDYFVQLVGLRGNIFLIPFLIFGALLNEEELNRLALWLGSMNLIAFGFAIAEYFIGVPSFFPFSPVTEIIYKSGDLVNFTAFRIPSTFGNSHAYGGTMAITLPILIGAWVQKNASLKTKIFLSCAIAGSLMGIFMSASRVHFIVASILVAVTSFSIRGRVAHGLGWIIIIVGILSLVSSEERLQRFMSLRDTDYVIERIKGSVNMTFFELVYQYPMGNGMGGGGTSLPYFLYDRVKRPVTMENEYARIVLEQGVIGLYIWALFIFWLIFRSRVDHSDPWFLGKRLALVASVCYFGTGLIGTGLFTSIPHTCLLFLNAGWMLSVQGQERGWAPVGQKYMPDGHQRDPRSFE